MLVDPDEAWVTVIAFGRWHHPGTDELEHDTATERAHHGRGIRLMNALVDEVSLRHTRRGTTVQLRARQET